MWVRCEVKGRRREESGRRCGWESRIRSVSIPTWIPPAISDRQHTSDISRHHGHFLKSFPSASSCFPRMHLTSSSWLQHRRGTGWGGKCRVSHLFARVEAAGVCDHVGDALPPPVGCGHRATRRDRWATDAALGADSWYWYKLHRCSYLCIMCANRCNEFFVSRMAPFSVTGMAVNFQCRARIRNDAAG